MQIEDSKQKTDAGYTGRQPTCDLAGFHIFSHLLFFSLKTIKNEIHVYSFV